MDLYARIKGVEYPISFGSTMSEEFNETLDSATINLPHVAGILDIKPYDDVYIHSSDFDISNVARFKTTVSVPAGKFYKHFLAWSINRDRINLSEQYYNYSIQLVSETKGLEATILPNRTVTQPKDRKESTKEVTFSGDSLSPSGSTSFVYYLPEGYTFDGNSISVSSDNDLVMVSETHNLNQKTITIWASNTSTTQTSGEFEIVLTYRSTAVVRSVYAVMKELVDTYAPYIKVDDGQAGDYWEYEQKYAISNPTKLFFQNVECPEMQFTSPTLREALNQLMMVKDCIVVVKDGLIRHLNKGQRNNPITSVPGVSWEQWTLSGDSYCDRVRRTYSNALSKDSTATFVEKMGFRNSDSPTMTLQNMRLEFSHPIYRIRKLTMCMYNAYQFNGQNLVSLCRWDITPIVLLDSYRNLISEDWADLKANPPVSLKEMAQYKLCTLGYSIGSTYITGWGEQYSMPVGWWQQNKTFIENIVQYVTEHSTMTTAQDNLNYPTGGSYMTFPNVLGTNSMISPAKNPDDPVIAGVFEATGLVTDFTQKMKTLFFECEYEGFVNGAITVAKDAHDGDITTIDNASSSMTIVETDGIFEKYKVNSLGNAAKTITARVPSMDASNLVSLGDYFRLPNEDGDEIVYKRTFSFQKDCVNVTYFLCANYILKNYFTSVWTKERPFALASYGESVRRQENRTVQLVVSAEHSYYQCESTQFANDLDDVYSKAVSFFNSTNFDGLHVYNDNAINACIYRNANYTGEYVTDSQTYMSGNTLCVNIPMKDNITAGVYINKIKPNFGSYITTALENIFQNRAQNEISGATQDWYWIAKDMATGYATNIDFVCENIDNEHINSEYQDEVGELYPYSQSDIYHVNEKGVTDSGIYQKLLSLPRNPFANDTAYITDIFKTRFAVKDGKETIDTTFEIAPVVEGYNVRLGKQFLGMSDLNPNAQKFSSTTSDHVFMMFSKWQKEVYTGGQTGVSRTNYYDYPTMTIYIPKGRVSADLVGTDVGITVQYGKKYETPWSTDAGCGNLAITYRFGQVTYIDEEKITITTNVSCVNSAFYSLTATESRNITLYRLGSSKLSEMRKMFLPDAYDVANRNLIIDVVNVDAVDYAAYATIEKTALFYTSGTSTERRLLFRQDQTSPTIHKVGYQVNLYDDQSDTYISGSTYVLLNTNFASGTSAGLRVTSSITGSTRVSNISWCLCPGFTRNDDVDDTIPTGSTEITVACAVAEQSSRGQKMALLLTTSTALTVTGTQSVRCYIDGQLAIAVNITSSDLDANNYLLKRVWLSFLDSRSKTVYSPTTGEPVGKIHDYAVDDNKTWGVANHYDPFQ